MIFKNSTDNAPVLSNVGQTGEFRIRNSAKAFGILSSGLYANKIRAIIREYSCNAVDSHIEAGKGDVPFDVHLPSALEPWFSVRDYGVGLDENQVRDIFTTYFESTKTSTDDLIGGLGLGSKSAFSYTDNFTIVAVKNGVKRVFTAFINDAGVPSIAPMGEEQSNEPAGVEIRFSVENTMDFGKFYQEAQHVYKHFKLRPVVTGNNFSFIDPVYETENIIPGVHSLGDSRGYYGRESVAVMGNIEYPIDVPADMDLGDLDYLLDLGLVIEFGIGELDIQASREGLSYIPETVAAIKNKLQQVEAVLADRAKEDLDNIKGMWPKMEKIVKNSNSGLWSGPTQKLIQTDKRFAFIDGKNIRYGVKLSVPVEELEKKYNIKIKGFYLNYDDSASTLYPSDGRYNSSTGRYDSDWVFTVAAHKMTFVVNDTNIGALQRAQHHWKNTDQTTVSESHCYVLEKADRKKEMKIDAFFKAIKNPPKEQILKASELMEKERAAGIAKNTTILKLEKRHQCGYHANSNDMVWREAAKLDSFDSNTTHYYVPLSGFAYNGKAERFNSTDFVRTLISAGILTTETVYGVRKTDIETVQELPNWINLDDYITEQLDGKSINLKGLVKGSIDFNAFFKSNIRDGITNPDSPFVAFYDEFADVETESKDKVTGMRKLAKMYDLQFTEGNVENEVRVAQAKMREVLNRYPLLDEVFYSESRTNMVIDYINAMDMMKGVE
jgi:hypothetical protein